MTYSGPTAILFKPSNQLEIERYRHFPSHFHRDSRFHLTTRCHFHQRSRRCHQVLLGTHSRRSPGCFRKRSSDYSGGRHQVLVYFQKSGSLSFTRQTETEQGADEDVIGQLTKDQLLSVLPLLIPHLQNPAFVIHTYAALTIERILFIKQDGAFLCVPSLHLRMKLELG